MVSDVGMIAKFSRVDVLWVQSEMYLHRSVEGVSGFLRKHSLEIRKLAVSNFGVA